MQKVFKGFTIIIVIFVFYIFSDGVKAYDTYFVWEKTVIDVPVFSSLEEFKDDYMVKLYVNGQESDDFEVDYEVNASTFSTVLTNKVGKYTVYYKAYSKNNYISSIQGIVFNVIDITSPEIFLLEDIIELNLNEKLSDVDWFRISDDTCKNSELNVTIDDSNVVYSNAGIYNCKLIASDLYNNTNLVNFKVRIVDKTKPTISIKKPLVFSYGEDIDIGDYIECKDNSGNDISNLLAVEGLDTLKLGKINILVKVTDYSGNEQEVILEAIVVDRLAPIISLTSKEVTLDIEKFSQYDEEFFKEFIYMVSDDYSKKSDIKLEIDFNDLECRVSDFIVYFIATDQNNNKTKREFIVKLRELIGPEIIVDDIIYLDIGEEVVLEDLVTIYDKYDSNVKERLIVECDDFMSTKSGSYLVKYICFNTSGIYSEKTVEIIVGNPSNINQNLTEEDNLFIYFIIIGSVIILISGGIVFYKFYIKRKKISY